MNIIVLSGPRQDQFIDSDTESFIPFVQTLLKEEKGHSILFDWLHRGYVQNEHSFCECILKSLERITVSKMDLRVSQKDLIRFRYYFKKIQNESWLKRADILIETYALLLLLYDD